MQHRGCAAVAERGVAGLRGGGGGGGSEASDLEPLSSGGLDIYD